MAVMSETNEWVIRWPDGSESRARTAYELLARLGKDQHDPVDVEAMKELLSIRAQTWSGKYIHPSQPDAAFLRELHRVSMIRIEQEGRF
jgi:hypothetical protein